MGLLSTIQQELVGQCRDKGRKEIVPVGIAAFDLTVDSSEVVVGHGDCCMIFLHALGFIHSFMGCQVTTF